MTTRSLAVQSLFAVLALGWLARAEAQGSWDDLFFRHVAGDVTVARVTPDGTRVVFLADLDVDEHFELFSAPTDGSAAPVQLHGPLTRHGDVSDRFTIAPDGLHVAFLADGYTNTVDELYCAPIDGSAPAVRVSTQAAVEFVTVFRFTPDSTRLVFQGRTSDQRDELWCVPLDGSSALEVSASMPPGGNPFDNFSISPDSTLLVYVADAVTEGVPEIFSAPLDASAPAVKLSTTPIAKGAMREYALTPDGKRVVYRADQDTAGVFELYSVPIDGSAAAVRISRAPTAIGDVEDGFGFTPAGAVLYRADHDTDNARDLYLVPADGSATAVRLNAAHAVDEWCEDFVATASGYVVYRADADANNVIELYSAPLDGSRTTVKLSGTMVSGGDVQSRYVISPDGTRVVYRADQDTNNAFEVYSAPLDGSSAALKLNPALPPGRSVAVYTPIDPSGRLVLFTADVAGDDQPDLLAAPIDGSGSAVTLTDQGLSFHPDQVNSFGFASGGSVVYRGVLDPEDVDFVEQLFVVPLDASAAPVVLHPTPALGELDGDILDFRLTHDGLGVVYLARERERRGLYVAPLSSPMTMVRLTGADVLQVGFAIGADDERVAFCAHNTVSNELFSVPLDGSAAAVKLSGTLITAGDVQLDFAVTADGARVVFRADAVEDNRFDLYSAPADGAMPPTQLSGTLVANGDVTGFRISPDGAYVVYLADQDVATRPELYSVPVDGSAAPVKLNGVLPLSCKVLDDYRIHPDGSRVLYRADEDLLAHFELHTVPIDGSAAATELNGALASGGSVSDFQLDASGNWVVYRAEQDVNFAFELYSGPSDGSVAALQLNPALVNQGNVGNYALTADAALVVFTADAAINDVNEVWSVPADGSAAAIRVHAPLSGQIDLSLWELTPDAAYVVMAGTAGPGTPVEIYSAPTDASASPVRLHGPVVQGQDVSELVVSHDSSRVLYRGDHDQNDVVELFSAPIDGSTTAEKISGVLVQGGSVLAPLRISADSSSVLFSADRAGLRASGR
ncbi:MAG: hypothetical protein HOP15_16985, partial [Planctomycetes bacterium]|nr:hypothetical protein [Planctomycetota bacterium]